MIAGVSLSQGTRTSIASLGSLSREIDASQRRLATGKRVIDPIDNPAAFFTASALSAQALSLNKVLDTLGTAEKTFSAANSGIKAIQTLLQTAQSLGNQALASPNTLVKVSGTNSTALTTATQIASTTGSSTRLRSGDTITIGDGTTTVTYTASNGDTVQSFLNAVNASGTLKVAASLNASGQIQLQATGTNNIVIGGTVASSSGLTGATGLTAGTYSFTANSTRQSLAQQFDSLRTQIDQIVQDSAYNGVNLLSGGSLSVSFNDSGSSKLAVTGAQLSATSLGIASVTTGSGGQFQTDTEVNAALANVASSLVTLQNQSSMFSGSDTVLQARRDFVSSMSDLLKTGADDLTAADSSEETALLLALQTRQQIALSALSLAGQQSQSVLRLFGA